MVSECLARGSGDSERVTSLTGWLLTSIPLGDVLQTSYGLSGPGLAARLNWGLSKWVLLFQPRADPPLPCFSKGVATSNPLRMDEPASH